MRALHDLRPLDLGVSTMRLQEYTDILEQFIDSHGLDVVLATAGTICDDKAAHIRESYNDQLLSKEWQKAGDYLAVNACHAVAVQAVSKYLTD